MQCKKIDYKFTFSGRPLVSIGNNNAASDESVEIPIRIPMAEWKLYASNVCMCRRKTASKFVIYSGDIVSHKIEF